MIDLQELRRLAETASQGKWSAGHSESGRPIVFDENMNRLLYSSRIIGSYRRCENDTAFIAAANPANITELLDCIETLTEAVLQEKAAKEKAEKVCRAFEAFEKAEWAYEEDLALKLKQALAEWRGE